MFTAALFTIAKTWKQPRAHQEKIGLRRCGVGRSQDGGLGGHGIRISAQLGHLPGTGGGPRTSKRMGGTPSDWVEPGAWGGVREEEKWRPDGTGTPEGRLGEGKGSHARRGKLGNHREGRGSKGSVARFPLPTWAPRNLLRSRA